MAAEVVRGSALLGYRELVTELGADADALLAANRVPLAGVGNHEIFIPHLALINAVEAAATVTRTPDFGRRLALRQGIDILGPLGVAVRTAPTVGDAIRIAATYQAAYAPAIALGIEPSEHEHRYFYSFAFLIDRLPPHRQATELALGVMLCGLRVIIGAEFRPLEVHLPHDPTGPEMAYRDFFGAPVQFDAPRAGMVLRAADLARQVSRDQIAHAAVVAYLESVAGGRDRSLAGRVRRLIRPLLATGSVGLDLVAAELGLHPRTVQRRLAGEGVTLQHLVDEARCQATERYLRDTDLTMAHIARELGYAEQSVLTRSCKRWFGLGPAALRAIMRAEVAAHD